MSGLRKSVRVSALVASIAMSLVASRPAQAQQDGGVLFQNVRIFDGKNGALSGPSNVLIRNNKIEKISTAAITADAQVIAGDGRVLMPGLIDAHWHALLVRPTPAAVMASDVGYTNLLAAAEATATLMRGFTTIRDMGGPAFSLKRAIDEGLVVGPRIYPSGAMITITGGHGDFRQLSDLPRTIGGMLSRMERIGGAMVADSPDEVRVRAREQLMQGRRRSSSRRAVGWRRRSVRSTCPRLLNRSCVPRWMLPRTGVPMSPYTPIPRSRSSDRSQRGSSASSTVI